MRTALFTFATVSGFAVTGTVVAIHRRRSSRNFRFVGEQLAQLRGEAFAAKGNLEELRAEVETLHGNIEELRAWAQLAQ